MVDADENGCSGVTCERNFKWQRTMVDVSKSLSQIEACMHRR